MDHSEFKSLSIIIPNYNGEKLIPVFLPTVIKAAREYAGQCEIIFVDDCSTDNSLKVIEVYRSSFSGLTVVKSDINGGFSKSCNLGISRARNEILFFLNSDVALEAGYFSYFSRHFDDPDLFAVTTCGFAYGSQQPIDGIKNGYWRRGFLRFSENYFDETIQSAGLTPPYLSFNIQGAYFFADAAKIHQLGGFDELYSPYIYEETDLAYRALKRGWKIVYEPRCRAYHQVSSSLSSVAGRFRIKRVSCRHRLLFTWKNIHSRRLLWAHFFFLALRLASLNAAEWVGLAGALRRMRAVATRRRHEKECALRSDEELLRFFDDYFSILKKNMRPRRPR
ncbi:MAG: glycosyltransferase [candidate division Zixibacteria bacterium]|nr:glycosyltransferase [candidate division Zixibacteria bacterium]